MSEITKINLEVPKKEFKAIDQAIRLGLDEVHSSVAPMRERLKEIKSEADELCKQWNEAQMNTKMMGRYEALAKLSDEIEKKCKAYNELSQKVCFEEVLMSPNPVAEAAIRYTYEVVRPVDGKIKEYKIPVKSINEGAKAISLIALNKKSDEGIGIDKGWYQTLEKLNKMLALRQAERMGCPPERIKEIDDSYNMKNVVKLLDEGKNPCSNNQLNKVLHTLIHQLLGDEYNPNKYDLNVLFDHFGKLSNKNQLVSACSKPNKTADVVLRICGRILKEDKWDVEFKKLKQ